MTFCVSVPVCGGRVREREKEGEGRGEEWKRGGEGRERGEREERGEGRAAKQVPLRLSVLLYVH